MSRLASLALLLAGSMMACGGRVPADEVATDTGVDPDSTSYATGPSPDDAEVRPDSPAPTAETCRQYVATLCSDNTKRCCETAELAWVDGVCNTNLDYYCNTLIDQVTLGRAVYDESYLQECLKGWESNLSACTVDGLTSAKNQVACTHLFNGTKKPGEACSGRSFVECEAPAGFGAYCDMRAGETTGRCRVYGFVGSGEPCNYYGSTVRYCDTGLYCDLTSPSATCKPVRNLGDACDGPDDLSCGLSNACKDSKCAAKLGAGETCTSNDECTSFECAMGACTSNTFPVVSAWMCNGSGG
jgi:hypothetical protein